MTQVMGDKYLQPAKPGLGGQCISGGNFPSTASRPATHHYYTCIGKNILTLDLQ